MPDTKPATWEVQAGALVLAPDTLHVWRHELDQGPIDPTVLDEPERARAGAFALDRDRMRFVAARCFVRSVIGRYVQLPASRVPLNVQESGMLSIGIAGAPVLSLSHADDVAYLAIAASGPLGVDVELQHQIANPMELALSVFSPAEIEELSAYPGSEASAAFLTAWTRKEAYVKAFGVGLFADLCSITVGTKPVDLTVHSQADSNRVGLIVRSLRCMANEHVAVAWSKVPRVTCYLTLH